MNNEVKNKNQLAYQSLIDCSNSILPLYDLVEKKVFKRLDYSRLAPHIQQWMMNAGSSEESSWSKELFDRFRKAYCCRTVNRILYYFDLTHLLGAIQDRFSLIEGAMRRVYSHLTYPSNSNKYVRAVRNSNIEVATTSSELYSVYIYMYSSMDLLTKTIFELDNMGTINYNSYPKLKSENVNYKRSFPFVKKFTGNNLFAPSSLLCEIIELRNRVIHNGGFDYSLWVYDCFSKDDTEESVIFLPDVIDGHIVKSVNRRNFYSQNRKANNILIEQVIDYCFLFKETVKQVITLYDEKDRADIKLTERYLSYILRKVSKIPQNIMYLIC